MDIKKYTHPDSRETLNPSWQSGKKQMHENEIRRKTVYLTAESQNSEER